MPRVAGVISNHLNIADQIDQPQLQQVGRRVVDLLCFAMRNLAGTNVGTQLQLELRTMRTVGASV